MDFIFYFNILCIILCILYIFNNNTFETFTNNHTSQKQLLFNKTLSDMKTILDQYNQEFFLTCGTLLGQYRENKFIEHDDDIDIGIFYSKFDIKIIKYIIQSNKFKLIRQLGKLSDSYELTFQHLETKIKIDIFIHYPIHDHYYYTASFYDICDTKTEGFCKWKYPIQGLKKITFYNKDYLIPNNTKEYLEFSYGPNFMIPKKFNYYEGLTNNNDGYTNLMN
tara:strand:+ start:46 stop:711 length:666 start_codon:yes stop_codon:yes gene_type:complete